MAQVTISEYINVGRTTNGGIIPVGQEPALATQTVTSSASAASSAAFNADTRFIRVVGTGDVHFRVGASPQTSTVSDPIIAAGNAEYWGVTGGHLISVIDV